MPTSDLALLYEAQRILRSLIGRTKRALQEDEDASYIPQYRVVEVGTLAEDPLYGDTAELLEKLNKRLKPAPGDDVGGDLVATIEDLASLDAKGYTVSWVYGDLMLAEKRGRTWLIEEDGAVVALGHGALVSLKRELDKRLGV